MQSGRIGPLEGVDADENPSGLWLEACLKIKSQWIVLHASLKDGLRLGIIDITLLRFPIMSLGVGHSHL